MRLIFHIDLDAFFASVEEVENPALSGKPVIVGGSPEERGVVAAANYAARQFGIHSALSMSLAVRRCPHALVLPPRRDLYQQYSERVMHILSQTSSVVEQLSIDEAFLDMEHQLADPLTAAQDLKQAIRREVDLTASIGIAHNKLLAKIASDSQKPDGLTFIPRGTEQEFLAPLPVNKLWGIGLKSTSKLNDMGVRTIADLTQLSEQGLKQVFGLHGTLMWQHARGIDHRPVRAHRANKSFSQETTFPRDISDGQMMQEALEIMSQTLAQRLQDHNLAARTVSLKLRYGDFNTLSRSHTQDPATKSFDDIYRRVLYLWQQHWDTNRPIRLIGMGVNNLVEGATQLSLFT